jgi:1-acyl-sn-glycerol-3-phosphate acyltransferase
VLSTFCPADFVAKTEIRRWPLLGRLLARNDCLFVDRRIGRHLLRLNADIGERLSRGRVVAFFPEGTTTDGAGMLPFRPALFEPAVHGGYPVQAFALAYRDLSGRRCDSAAFIDQQSLWQSLLAIASQPGIVVALRASPAIAAEGLSRRQAARFARAAIQEKLAGSLPVGASSLSAIARLPPHGDPVPVRG